MSKCIDHQENLSHVSVPKSECEICIRNAFDPKKCRICREKNGYEIADGLVVCPDCEGLYFSEGD